MKLRLLLPFFLLLTVICLVQTAGSATMIPDTLDLEGIPVQLNGQGTRTKFFLTLYEAGLYLQKKNNDAATIVAAEEPMAIRLHISSSMITSEKMENATMEGFVKSTGGDTQSLQEEIDSFIAVFREEIKEGDMYDMIYLPGSGVTVLKNDVRSTIIPGLPFKKALFGIWLSPDPVQESLKKELLGGK